MFSKAAKSKERQAINNPEYRINRQIRAREVRLIDQNNENVGVVPFLRALEMAETADLDLEKAGLEEPSTYDSIRAAAQELDSPDVAGFVGANIAGDAFTEQTFEHIALGNGCQMVDDAGEVTIDSPECVEAFDFYGELQQDYSVSGEQDVGPGGVLQVGFREQKVRFPGS